MRKDPLYNNEHYHIMNKSIAGFVIFNNENEFMRALQLLRFYQNKQPSLSFSQFSRLPLNEQKYFLDKNKPDRENKLVEMIAYCFMPTHFHLLLEQMQDKGISTFIKNILISYTRYFNIRHHRKGPLWESRFKSVLIKDDTQLLHLTRYLHLNPVSAELVENPNDWLASSYKEYLDEIKTKNKICCFKNILDIQPKRYAKFVEDRTAYQRQLTRIKKILLE